MKSIILLLFLYLLGACQKDSAVSEKSPKDELPQVKNCFLSDWSVSDWKAFKAKLKKISSKKASMNSFGIGVQLGLLLPSDALRKTLVSYQEEQWVKLSEITELILLDEKRLKEDSQLRNCEHLKEGIVK